MAIQHRKTATERRDRLANAKAYARTQPLATSPGFSIILLIILCFSSSIRPWHTSCRCRCSGTHERFDGFAKTRSPAAGHAITC